MVALAEDAAGGRSRLSACKCVGVRTIEVTWQRLLHRRRRACASVALAAQIMIEIAHHASYASSPSACGLDASADIVDFAGGMADAARHADVDDVEPQVSLGALAAKVDLGGCQAS